MAPLCKETWLGAGGIRQCAGRKHRLCHAIPYPRNPRTSRRLLQVSHTGHTGPTDAARAGKKFDEEGGSAAANPAIDAQILAQIEAEFTAIGYTRVAAGTPSDVVVLVTATRVDLDYWHTVGWWDYWGWWPGWGPELGPGWAPAYPWGPSYPGRQSLGTLAITMLDPNSTVVEDQEIPATWVGAVNELLIGSDANILARMVDLIDQVFLQSPYL